MSNVSEYDSIFQVEIIQKSKGVIFSFSPVENGYTYQAYSHGYTADSVENLAMLMRHNLFFYAFGEEEVVAYYKKDCFESLETAASYAYKQRLPKRLAQSDGLPSEVLLDLLVQLYNPNAYKLAVRTIFRQDDNNEIKGYDLTYFTKDEEATTLWLGQAKLGAKNYCKSGINLDLINKYKIGYLTSQLYFVCDKRVNLTEDAKTILQEIENINIRMLEEDADRRAKSLVEYFNTHNIKIKIPCLLAYGKDSVYQDASQVYLHIEKEIESARQYFSRHTYNVEGLNPEIVFYVFPLESLERLRDERTGFYAGLC